jgi:large subunit ribosomal protein L4
MKASVLNMTGNEVGEVELPPYIFEAKVNRALMHQALVRQLSNARLGTHKAKTRSEVQRTTAKWYRQKGTGRARHGSRRAPIFVGGGVAHGPQPRSYQKSMPRKMRRAALRSALTVKAHSGEIVLLDELDLERPQTKDMVSMLQRLTGTKSTLILTAGPNENVEMSVRNMAEATALRANYLNIRDLLGHRKVVIPIAALEIILGYLGHEDSVPSIVIGAVTGSMDEEE